MRGFKGIVGEAREIGILKGSISSKRVAHALLFAGPEGIGKRLVARAFAKALNCVLPRLDEDVDSCGACRDCLAFDSGTHPNLREVWPVDKDGERGPPGLIKINHVKE